MSLKKRPTSKQAEISSTVVNEKFAAHDTFDQVGAEKYIIISKVENICIDGGDPSFA